MADEFSLTLANANPTTDIGDLTNIDVNLPYVDNSEDEEDMVSEARSEDTTPSRGPIERLVIPRYERETRFAGREEYTMNLAGFVPTDVRRFKAVVSEANHPDHAMARAYFYCPIYDLSLPSPCIATRFTQPFTQHDVGRSTTPPTIST